MNDVCCKHTPRPPELAGKGIIGQQLPATLWLSWLGRNLAKLAEAPLELGPHAISIVLTLLSFEV